MVAYNSVPKQLSPEGIVVSDSPYSAKDVQKVATDAPKSGVQVNTGYKMSLNTGTGTVRIHTAQGLNMGEDHPRGPPQR
jgi:hypothetical protein